MSLSQQLALTESPLESALAAQSHCSATASIGGGAEGRKKYVLGLASFVKTLQLPPPRMSEKILVKQESDSAKPFLASQANEKRPAAYTLHVVRTRHRYTDLGKGGIP
ncbi:hypothetical protein E2C01_082304 [Portunus trituberculatus]|uniref:Uncharacterized protein n=1 Tax=Portunus trituberculatus TaxID=210409 RepID=A0A5B7IU66_PORTR|nr:hypothetical protein [Portunus trituberculatus]